jgi:Mlc titration factor MtfA (ptsG expression regulator)
MKYIKKTMDLENYTNINIFKRTYEQREVPNKDQMIVHSHDIVKQGNKAASGPM